MQTLQKQFPTEVDRKNFEAVDPARLSVANTFAAKLTELGKGKFCSVYVNPRKKFMSVKIGTSYASELTQYAQAIAEEMGIKCKSEYKDDYQFFRGLLIKLEV